MLNNGHWTMKIQWAEQLSRDLAAFTRSKSSTGPRGLSRRCVEPFYLIKIGMHKRHHSRKTYTLPKSQNLYSTAKEAYDHRQAQEDLEFMLQSRKKMLC